MRGVAAKPGSGLLRAETLRIPEFLLPSGVRPVARRSSAPLPRPGSKESERCGQEGASRGRGVERPTGERGELGGCSRFSVRPRRRVASVSATRCSPESAWCRPPSRSAPDASALRQTRQTGSPDDDRLIAYLDREPVGWCAVEPRRYDGMVRGGRVAWSGRCEDRGDDAVWAITCFVTRAGLRGRGISRALAFAAVSYAREHGARAVEGYP